MKGMSVVSTRWKGFLLALATVMAGGSGAANADEQDTRAVFLAELPELRFFAEEEMERGLTEASIVRLLYDRLEDATRIAGTPVKVEIDQVRTLYVGDFARVRWADLVSQIPEHLTVERTELTVGSSNGVAYRARWRVDAWRRVHPELAETNVAETIAGAAPTDPRLDRLVAITAYRVRAEHAGQSIVYNAALLWIRGDGTDLVSMMLQDHVTDHVDEALLDRVPHVDPRTFMARLVPALPDAITSPEKTYVCHYRDSRHSYPVSAGIDWLDHRKPNGSVIGSHSASARFGYACNCSTNCRSTCIPEIQRADCNETGTITRSGKHQARASAKIQPGSLPNATTTGAQCGAGAACFIEFCPLNYCAGVSITPSVRPADIGVEITFSADRPTVWDGQIDFPFTCDGCTIEAYAGADSVPILNPDPDPGGSGGGGGTGGACSYIFYCVQDPNNPNGEICTVICR